MKKIILWCIALCVAASGYGQKQKQSSPQHIQGSEATVPDEMSKLIDRINDINHQIDSLKKDLLREYQEFSSQKFYTDKKFREDSLAKIEEKKTAIQKKIDENMVIITPLEEEYKAMDSIREYYEKGNIDSLYTYADQMTLNIHKKIFGEKYPKVMDDLLVLLECAGALKKMYDEKQNKTCIQRLKGVRKCDTKDVLEGFLLVQKDVTDEVNSWIKNEEHTLYSLVMFRSYLYNNYGIKIDSDYPYLSAKVIKAVELPKVNKQ